MILKSSMEPIYRNWGETLDQHLVGDWYTPLPTRVIAQIRPLARDYTKWAWDNVFATVKNPFDPRRATGWMAKVFASRDKQAKAGVKTGRTLKDVLKGEFVWDENSPLFVLHSPEHGYETTVALFLQYAERFFTYFDSGVVVHPTDQNVLVYWDTTGPWFGKRRDRRLPTKGAPELEG